jgi:murein DD-endopeptidase MepM/ murein hydrolase activator NlpD
MGGLQPEPGELEAIQAFKSSISPERFWQLPLKPPTPDCMNSPFGNLRFHNGKFTGNFHKGIDTRSPQGRPVKAATDGIVTMARVYRLHGGTVGVDHGQGLKTIHIHLSKILVTPGQRVTQGQTLGLVGATGFATGPHLHWGVFAGGEPVNPVWITRGIRACGH